MTTYAWVYFGSALIAQMVTPLIARLAKARGLVDTPGVRKVHTSPIPRIGGVAIVVAVLATVIPVLKMDNLIGESFRSVSGGVGVLLVAAVFVFCVGLVDDIRGISSRIKLAMLLLAALAVCWSGVRIQYISLAGGSVMNLGWLSWPITVLWIVAVTVGINFIDGLDGLAAGISAIVCGVVTIVALYAGQAVLAVLMLALLGSLTGFLFFNFNPAKIFMGDCGSMFLGFILSAGSVMCVSHTTTLVGIILPAIALGVPILDTAFAIIRRGILDRRSIFSAERGHIHHRLIDRGLQQREAVTLIHIVTLMAAGVGMIMLITGQTGAVVVPAVVFLILLLLFQVAGAARLKETGRAIRRNLGIARKVRQERHSFENMQLRIREAKSFEDWWETICTMADEMEFLGVTLSLVDGGTTYRPVWRRPGPEPFHQETISMNMPIKNCAPGSSLQIDVTVIVNGSLEAAGRRISLFGRLIDERSLPDVPRRIHDMDRPPEAASQVGPPAYASAPGLAGESQTVNRQGASESGAAGRLQAVREVTPR